MVLEVVIQDHIVMVQLQQYMVMDTYQETHVITETWVVAVEVQAAVQQHQYMVMDIYQDQHATMVHRHVEMEHTEMEHHV